MKVKKAVILAAGLGTRFLPITKSVSKEMLPIGNKPVIHYIVEECKEAGIEEVIIITNENKRDLMTYFSKHTLITDNIEEKGKRDLLKEIDQLIKDIKVSFAYQIKPMGVAQALKENRELFKYEPVAMLYGDDLFDGKDVGIKQLMDLYEKEDKVIIGSVKVDKKDIDKYGIICRDSKGKVHIKEKPRIGSVDSTDAIVGRYILTPELIDRLDEISYNEKHMEYLITDLFDKMASEGKVTSKVIKGNRYDAGNPKGLLEANNKLR